METLAQVTADSGLSQWQVMAIIGLATAILGASAGWIGSAVTARKHAVDDRQTLIDQLQEERNAILEQLDKERLARNADREASERRQDQFWTDKAASRSHVAALREHIWARREPPPPEPPAGYIE